VAEGEPAERDAGGVVSELAAFCGRAWEWGCGVKFIKFYRVVQYGVTREYVHPDCAGDAGIIRGLTGQKTIDGRIRELLRDLFCGGLEWREVLAPRAGDTREPLVRAMEGAS
jgi:hypothetical protein